MSHSNETRENTMCVRLLRVEEKKKFSLQMGSLYSIKMDDTHSSCVSIDGQFDSNNCKSDRIVLLLLLFFSILKILR